MDPKKFFSELKRRNVYKVAIAYGVVAWLLIQVATQVFPFFEIPNWTVRLVVLLVVIGFPIALIIAWAFELTPQGLKRTQVADALSGQALAAAHVDLCRDHRRRLRDWAILLWKVYGLERRHATQHNFAGSRKINRGAAIRESKRRKIERLFC